MKFVRELLDACLERLFDLDPLSGDLFQRLTMALKLGGGLGQLSLEIGDLTLADLVRFHLCQQGIVTFSLQSLAEFTCCLELSLEFVVLHLDSGVSGLRALDFVAQSFELRLHLGSFVGLFLERRSGLFQTLDGIGFVSFELGPGTLVFCELMAEGSLRITMSDLEFGEPGNEAFVLVARHHGLMQGCDLIRRTPCLGGMFERLTFGFITLLQSGDALLFGHGKTGLRSLDALFTQSDLGFGISGDSLRGLCSAPADQPSDARRENRRHENEECDLSAEQ